MSDKSAKWSLALTLNLGNKRARTVETWTTC